MSLSTALEIGKNGLNVYQGAIEVTSQNVSNVNTPGYSRQRVVLETSLPTTGTGLPLGAGVRIASVQRYYDSLVQQQLVNAQTTQGYDTTKSNVLQQIEPSFNEISNDGIAAAMSNFFGSWQDMSLNPTGASERQMVLTRGQALMDNFHSVSTTINNTISTQNDTLVPLTDSINASLKSIALVNSQIRSTSLVDGNVNELKDQRDQLISDLSQKMGVKFSENADGMTDVYVNQGGNKFYLVQGVQYGSINLSPTPPSTSTYAVTAQDVNGATSAVDNTMYSAPDGGQLWATMQLRDTIIPGYLDKVDTLANAFVTTINAQHSAGFSPTGGSGQDFFTAPGAVAGSAANISFAAGLTTSTLAASGNGIAGDTANALKMAGLGGILTIPTGATPTATFSSYYSSLVSTVGLDVQSSKNTVAQDEAFTKQMSTLRESTSGVSLDEELTNLIKYQRSYQASAKLITTVSDMMDMVIGMVR